MKEKIVSALCVAIGISLAGLFVFLGLNKNADKDRSVTVKGLSTRTVEADHAVWPLSFAIAGNDLQVLYNESERVSQVIIDMLKARGFKAEDLQIGNTTVEDKWDSYSYENRPEYKYQLNSSVIVSTDDVQLVVKSAGCQSELLNRGIIVNSSDWQLDYQYNGLPELKPEMIEEATKNARAVAQKFANDAECDLGSISRASQGQFSIESDPYQPWIKHVRVVTTIDYKLD
ncbi:MAG: SIMPL domain-containing protein [Paludibacteraceae bacterium]|nr:SIMPL domain-containing protein [Paludibacteraceae bacterium]